MYQIRIRQGRVATTWVLFVFLLCCLFGRFGVAFLGFAFNLEDHPYYIPPTVRPDWENGTVNGDDSFQMALASGQAPVDGQPIGQ